MSNAAEIPRRYYFEGRVQGVGFRATTASIARRHPVRGYVKNLRDGRVELVAQGAASVLGAFLAEIEAHFQGYIERRTTDDPGPITLGNRFEVR